MRKNRTKHEAKKPRLAKRALALCFALIFVCSCLLPAFANSEMGALADPLTMVEQQDEQKPTDPVLLTEGGTDSTEGNEQKTTDNPTEGNEQKTTDNPTEGNEQQPTEPEQPKNEGSAEQQGNEQTKPEEPKTEGTTESKDSTEEQPKNEGTTGETKPEETKPEGTTEEPKTEETKPEEPKQPTTNTTGDTIEQGKATYTYRFWPDKIDAFELEAINDDVKSGTSLNDAAQSRAGMVPCTVLTVMTNANLRDYQANVQQPTKDGYEFAGWYTVDGTTEDTFSFEQNLNFEESQTIDVFAKWNELVTLRATTTVDVDATLFGGEAAISLADEYSYEDDRMAAPTKTLTLDVEATNLSSNSELSVSSASSSAIEDYCDSNELVPILTLDITPKDKDSGKKTEPRETSTVTISGLSELELPNELTMVHKKDDGEIEKIPAQYSNGTLTFETDSFSTFAVAALGTEIMTVGSGPNDYEKPNHEDNKVFLYVDVVGDTTGLTLNGNGWYTLGWVDVSNYNIDGPKNKYSNYSTSGSNWEAAMAALAGKNSYSEGDQASDANWGINSNVHRYKDNTSIALKDVNWTHHGLKSAFGAKDYEDYNRNNNAYIGHFWQTWHFDGYIEVSNFADYTIEYYDKDTNEQIKDPYVETVAKDTEIDISSNLTLKPETIEANGVTYQYDSASPSTKITVRKQNNANVIKLYYTKTLTVTITKKVEGGGDTNKDFYFKITGVTLSNNNKGVRVYDRNGNLLSEHKDTFALKDGDSAKICGLTSEKSFTLQEFYYETDSNGNPIDESGNTISNDSDKVIPIEYDTSATNYKEVVAGSPKNFEYKVYEENGKLVLKASGREANITSTGVVEGNEIVVTNTLASTSLTITKKVKNDNAAAPGDDVFNFRLTVGKDAKDYQKVKVTDKNGNAISAVNNSNKKNVWEFTLGNLDSVYVSGLRLNDDAVTVEEINLDSHYTPSNAVNGKTSSDGKVASLGTLQKSGNTVVFTNTYTPATTSLTVRKTVAIGNATAPANATFKFRLTVGSEAEFYEGVTFDPSTSVEHTANTNEWTFTLQDKQSVTFSGIRLDDKDVKVEEVEVDSKHYSTKHSVNDGTETTGTKAAVTNLQQNSNTVDFTNTYSVPNLSSMTIQKKVTGAFGERTKEFAFSVELTNTNPALLNDVSYTNQNGATVPNLNSVKLTHGQSVELKNIPIDTTITVTESDANDYKTSATGHSKSIKTPGARTFTYKVEEEGGKAVLKSLGEDSEGFNGSAITVENNFDGTPDTGVLLDTLPYLILLAVAVAGGVLVVVRKRKHRDE